MHSTLARIVDGSELHEHRAGYGSTLIIGWARINGTMVIIDMVKLGKDKEIWGDDGGNRGRSWGDDNPDREE